MTSNIVFSEKKQKDMEWAKGIVSRIEADRRKFVKYKDSRPITDIKHMIETSAELYGDNTAFYQKYKGDETFTAISYRQMIEKVNGLGTALIHHGLQGKRIAVIGENCSEWAISYLAVICGTVSSEMTSTMPTMRRHATMVSAMNIISTYSNTCTGIPCERANSRSKAT